jgi:hypothetical protein
MRGWEDTIKTDLKEIWCDSLKWIRLDRIGTSCGLLWILHELSSSVKCEEFLDQLSGLLASYEVLCSTDLFI